MARVKNGKRNGGNIMMRQVNRKNGPINGVALTPIHNLKLVMLTFGMKGEKLISELDLV